MGNSSQPSTAAEPITATMAALCRAASQLHPRASCSCCGSQGLLDQPEKRISVFSVTFTSPAYYGALGKPELVGWNSKVGTRSEVFISEDKWLLKAFAEGCRKAATYKIQISRSSKSFLKFSHILLKLVEWKLKWKSCFTEMDSVRRCDSLSWAVIFEV